MNENSDCKSLSPPVELFINNFVVNYYQLSNLGHMDGFDRRSAITLSEDNKWTKKDG